MREAVGRFVEGAVAGEHGDDVGAPVGRFARECRRVLASLRLQDLDRVLDAQRLRDGLAVT